MRTAELKNKIISFLEQASDVNSCVVCITNDNIYIKKINDIELNIGSLFYQNYTKNNIKDEYKSKFIEANCKISTCITLLTQISEAHNSFKQEYYYTHPNLINRLLITLNMAPLIFNRIKDSQ